MKKLNFILLLLFLSTSCSEELIQLDDFSEDSDLTTRAAGDGKYDVLGYGYNCFYSDFRDPKYSKAKVIDIDMLTSGIGRSQITGNKVQFVRTEVIEAILHGKAETRVAYGETIEKLTQDIEINTKTKVGNDLLKLFSLDIKLSVNSSDTLNTHAAFYRIDALRITRKLTLPYTNASRLRYFVTDEFLSDLEFLSGKELVNKYGTHVATDILLGGNFSGLYTGSYVSHSSQLKTEFKAKASSLLSSLKAEANYDVNSFKSFKNVNIYISTQGGTVPVTTTISQSMNGQLDNVSINYNDWFSSVTTTSESLIGVGSPDTEIHLISDFIDNPIKKKEVEKALCGKPNGRIFMSWMFRDSQDRPLMLGFKGPTDMTLAIWPYSSPMRGEFMYEPIKQGAYYKIKSRSNHYLDSKGAFCTASDDSSQLWNIIFLEQSPEKFMAQNVKTGKYLSWSDAKLHDFNSINESKLIWIIKLD